MPYPSDFPRCCGYWPHCSHTLALYERWKRGGKMSKADMLRLETVEAAMNPPVAKEKKENF